MNKQCTNCPGRTDHTTAECPIRAGFEAYMLGREHPVFGWISSNWLGRGDDPSTYENDYVQGCWVIWQSRPGVPDGLFLGDALLMCNRRHDNPPIHVGYEYGVADALLQMLAAPTVKAERVAPDTLPCEECQGNGELVTDWDRYLRPEPGDVGDEAVAECPKCDGTGRVPEENPSLPAAGSAVEEVEVVGYRIYWPAVGMEPSKARTVDPSEYESKKPVFHTCVEPAMTVAQHERIVAALSAQDVSGAARDVLAERQRQITAEGYDSGHDDMATRGQLAIAAGCYAMWSGHPALMGHFSWKAFFPWDWKYWKPSTPRRNLIKAGALILAEIERLDRAEQAKQQEQQP